MLTAGLQRAAQCGHNRAHLLRREEREPMFHWTPQSDAVLRDGGVIAPD
jgi:hypothetical protein